MADPTRPPSNGQSATTETLPPPAPVATSPDDPTVALNQKIQELETKLREKENQYLYLYADFENFKKRAFRERQEIVQYGWEPVANELVQVLDNMERALNHTVQPKDACMDNVLGGLDMVFKQFLATMTKFGVKPIEALNKTFDPSIHEAVGREASDAAEGSVIREESRGYIFYDRLLRPARVIISSGPTKAQDN